MLIIYFKSDGEIYQVASGYKSLLDYFGERTQEFGLIFDAIYIEVINDYVFNRPFEFKVINEKLTIKENNLFEILKKDSN